ncbi:MAG: hypothetical protein R3253_09230, partial [Longimicrobiales bacterium]|nr:hypothetical protein [Longimicrobiales bacterium]
MKRILAASLVLIAVLAPVAVGAQGAPTSSDQPWWLQVIVFVVSLPYTLWMVFVEGERLMLLPAPLLAIGFMIWSFREWRRQRYWTPRIVHILAGLGLLTIIAINVDWVMAGGEMWTQRYVVIAIFGIFPYLAYLLFLGPRLLGRRRAPGVAQADRKFDDVPIEKIREKRRTPLLAGAAVVILVGFLGLAYAGGSSGPTSIARP